MRTAPATAEADEALLQTLNPVVDLNKDLHLYGAINVDKIDLQDDRLTGSGATTIPLLPENLESTTTLRLGDSLNAG